MSIKDFLLESFNIGVFLQAHDGVLLGGLFILFILVFSLYSEETICDFLKRTMLGRLLVGVFIATFIAYILRNSDLISAVSSQYPMFLTIFQVLDLVEIILLTTLGILAGIVIIYIIMAIVIFRWMIYCLIFSIALSFLLSIVEFHAKTIDQNLPQYICFGIFLYTLYKSDDIRYGFEDYIAKLKKNLTCWFTDE